MSPTATQREPQKQQAALRMRIPNANSNSLDANANVNANTAIESDGTINDKKHSDSKEVWWVNGAFVIAAHCAAVATLVFVSPTWQTVALTASTIVAGEFGITMGYHRLWSHGAFSATPLLRVILAWMGTLGFQGSIRWWVLRHRLHHRYTDDLVHDPYSAARGFWFSHMGWIFEKPIYTRMSFIDTSDLSADWVVRFQHKYFVPIALTTCFVLPPAIGALWGDSWAAFLYAGVCARIAIWHLTFCINSFAHWLGDQHFSERTTARGGFLLAVLTQGEGYHNYHHEFPRDYRNGPHPLDWDPTKWLISLASHFGLAYNLHTQTPNEIAKARVATTIARAQKYARTLDWGPAPASLPTVSSLSDVGRFVGHAAWIVVDEFVVDVKRFLDEHAHPGGNAVVQAWLGKRDGGKGFYGVLNRHTDSAKRMVEMMRVAKLELEE
ncbi:hypothetical protein HK100_004926 [Physocladia obscura]|uniref:Acyl-CoA desaturase n=1 Tax=Physocladia obscura TaxID=109957 RepID=A0AAD5XKS5_9FUNG|nr:hypothetical protein HK100_004926 [Physocladia obscura]